MRTCGLILLGFLPVVAMAETDENFVADLELGTILTSGNTETSTFKGKLGISQNLEKWRNKYVLEGLYKKDKVTVGEGEDAQSDNQTTAQKYFASGQADYKLDQENKGLFVFGSYEDDRFSGYAYQSTIAIGYSDQLFSFENSRLDYSVGPGMSFAKTEDTLDSDGNDVEGETTQDGIVRLSVDYLYKFSDHAKFTQKISSDLAVESASNSRTKSETAVSANINSSLAMKFSYIVNHNTHVPDGKKHADTQTAVTLVFSF